MAAPPRQPPAAAIAAGLPAVFECRLAPSWSLVAGGASGLDRPELAARGVRLVMGEEEGAGAPLFHGDPARARANFS